MAKTAIDAQRLNAFAIDPDKLTIVGLDTNDGKDHPLYDERAKLPAAENLVLNMMVHGWTHGAIEVRKNGQLVEVVVGRQRVKAAREANRRLTSEGKEPVFARVFVRGMDGADAMGVMISENENRLDDTPIMKAEKCRRYLALGRSEADAANVFGVTVHAVRQWMRVFDLAEPVQKAVRAGKVPFHAAVGLVELDRDAQVAALDSMPADGAPLSGKEVRQRVRMAKGDDRAERPGIRKIRRLIEANEAEAFLPEGFAKALRWVLGDIDDRAIRGVSAAVKDAAE